MNTVISFNACKQSVEYIKNQLGRMGLKTDIYRYLNYGRAEYKRNDSPYQSLECHSKYFK